METGDLFKTTERRNNISIWRLQTNTDNETGQSVSDYCINNGVLALGWSLKDSHLANKGLLDDLIKSRANISEGTEDESFNKYEDYVNQNNIYKSISNITRLKTQIKPYDLIWMRNNGVYWLGLVGEHSRYFYDSSEMALSMDASNQRTDIRWIEVGGESDVAGVITTSFIKGHTLQTINQEGVVEFSKYVINTLYKHVYELERFSNNPKTLFNLISPNDCEDVLCMWLNKKYGYVTVPSTCKTSTQLYECVLINPEDTEKKEIYIQVKKGDVDLNYSDYRDLDGEVWLFTTNGKINGEKYPNMNAVDPKTIYDFIMSGENDNYLPRKIIKWRGLLEL